MSKPASIRDIAQRVKRSAEVNNAVSPARAVQTASCSLCGGIGYFRRNLPVGHPDFGQVDPCVCRPKAPAFVYLAHMNRLGTAALQKMTFSAFKPRSSTQAKALVTANEYAQGLDGWLFIEGERYCGKTHLAAAICNQVVSIPALFLNLAEFLEQLELASNTERVTMVNMLDEVRGAKLLVLDGYGDLQGTDWSQEKMFQVINARYINRLPTIITTRRKLDDFEGRVRSRLMDDDVVRHISFRVV